MWISTQMVHRRVEMRIDQINIVFSSQFSKLPKSEVFRSWDRGEESCSCVCHFVCALLLLFTCCSARLLPICPLFCCKGMLFEMVTETP